MREWLKVGLGIAIFVCVVAAFVAQVYEAKREREYLLQVKKEWTAWVESSCDLASDLTVALTKQLASWHSDAPSDLLLDFEVIREIEAQVMSQVDASVVVPTKFSCFVRYRFRQAAATLPDRLHADDLIHSIDSCADDVHRAMVAFKQEVDEETSEIFADESFDHWPAEVVGEADSWDTSECDEESSGVSIDRGQTRKDL